MAFSTKIYLPTPATEGAFSICLLYRNSPGCSQCQGRFFIGFSTKIYLAEAAFFIGFSTKITLPQAEAAAQCFLGFFTEIHLPTAQPKAEFFVSSFTKIYLPAAEAAPDLPIWPNRQTAHIPTTWPKLLHPSRVISLVCCTCLQWVKTMFCIFVIDG